MSTLVEVAPLANLAPKLPRMVAPSTADQVPKDLAELNQWVSWHYAIRGGQPTKIPIQVNAQSASSTNPATWTTFEQAFDATKRNPEWGVGFVFRKDGGMVGIDLDDCVDGGGRLKSWAQPIIEKFADTYMEVSPSGTGVKIFCRGNLEGLVSGTGSRKAYGDGEVEIYQHGRYFTVTGKCFNGAPLEIEEHRADLDWLLSLVGIQAPAAGGATATATVPPPTGRTVDLSKIIVRPFNVDPDLVDQLGPEFRPLLDKPDPDQSRADWQFLKFIFLNGGVNCTGETGIGFTPQSFTDWLCWYRNRVAKGEHRKRKAKQYYVLTLTKWYRWLSERAAGSDQEPEDLPDPEQEAGTMETVNIARVGRQDASQITGAPKPLRYFPYTDSGNAERIVARYGLDIRYCHQQKTWYVWDGKHWPPDRVGTMMRIAKSIARELYEEAAAIEGDTERKICVTFARQCESTDRKRSALVSAQSEPGIPILPEDFDRDLFLFNVLNGTIDLQTGALRAPNRADLISKLAPVMYDPGARSQLWDRVLDEVTGGSRELQDFLQRAVGYSLTGDVREEKLFFVHGPGASGKSTFLEAIKSVLGDYAKTADFETFVQRQAGSVRDDVAELAGRRFVVSIEVDEGKKLAEGLTKMLTGGDTVRARLLYQQGFEFVPQFKLWLAANHEPRVRHDDSAMWRRILRVPFEHVVPKAKRDPSIKARLKDVKESGPAILAWAVEGCLRWREEGLGVPPVVEEATEQYRLDMDPLKDFLADCCILKPTAWLPIARLRQAYEHYCKERGDKHLLTPNEFAAGLRARNCEPQRRHPGAGWRGIGLLAEDTTPGPM